jgi:hypothetical protein
VARHDPLPSLVPRESVVVHMVGAEGTGLSLGGPPNNSMEPTRPAAAKRIQDTI